MSFELKMVNSANDLPVQWDELAEEYFQLREFLFHAEIYNPCNQRYCVCYNAEVLSAGLVVYTLSLNLFTYSFIRLPFSMSIAGIPCSVSAGGFIGDTGLFDEVLSFVKARMKGFLVVLNLNSNPGLKDIMTGNTLPAVIMHNTFSTWQDYLDSLRADYRRRMKLITKPFGNIRSVSSDCSSFTREMHQQYLDVLESSKGKLETLSYEFFCHLPNKFTLTACHDGEKLLGWYITVSFKAKFYFFLGGFDYKANAVYNTYQNLLISLLKEGIEQSFSLIDLGQTAEIPKMRLGGKLQEKWMLGYHSKMPIRKLIIAFRGLLEYKGKFPETHVFKEKS